MPLYEYRCRNCGERTEVLQHLGDSPLTTCPRCGGVVDKTLSAPALQFKGSGWYVTDYGKGNGRNATKAAAEEKTAAPSAGDKPTSSDTTTKKAS
jgi:putative FmdB family regulatory protein